MVESGTLLRCYTGNGIEGSNPSLSALKFSVYSVVRLSRHVWDVEVAGSNPATPTNFSKIRDFFQVCNLITAIFKTFLTFYFIK